MINVWANDPTLESFSAHVQIHDGETIGELVQRMHDILPANFAFAFGDEPLLSTDTRTVAQLGLFDGAYLDVTSSRQVLVDPTQQDQPPSDPCLPLVW